MLLSAYRSTGVSENATGENHDGFLPAYSPEITLGEQI